MKTSFIPGLREAVRLTRTGKLAEATRLIQDGLLSARPGSHGAPTPATPFERASFGAAQRARAGRSAVNAADVLKRAPGPGPAPDGAAFLTRSFSGRSGTRAYKLYVPGNRRPPSGLIVMLHGCTQDADDFAAGTAMNQVAEEQGLLVAYPIQSRGANPSLCWNWFGSKDQRREEGEPAIIAGLTRELIAEFHVDPRRVFIAGLSAGGAMAAIMGALYGDIYDAVGVHSGLQYGAADDLMSALAAMRGDARSDGRGRSPRAAGAVRTIVFHGDSDTTVHPSNGEAIAAAAKSGLEWFQEEIVSGRSPGGIAYRRLVARDAAGRPIVEHWTLKGVAHAWSGGDPAGSYTDPRGPDATREMVRFFLEA